MTPTMETALDARRVMLAGLIRIELPEHTLRLCDGSAVLAWGSESFSGRDPIYGTIGEFEAISEEVGDIAPGIDISLLPPSLSAATDLVSPAMQGAAVRVWLAAIDPDQGTVIVRKGLRTRMRSEFANTAGRKVSATITGSASSRPAMASHGAWPLPLAIVSAPSQHATRTRPAPPIIPAIER